MSVRAVLRKLEVVWRANASQRQRNDQKSAGMVACARDVIVHAETLIWYPRVHLTLGTQKNNLLARIQLYPCKDGLLWKHLEENAIRGKCRIIIYPQSQKSLITTQSSGLQLMTQQNYSQCREREVGTDSRLTVFKYSVAL